MRLRTPALEASKTSRRGNSLLVHATSSRHLPRVVVNVLREWSIDPITVYLSGLLYYFTGNWDQMPRANDRTVTDADSAIAHEYSTHILPSLASLEAIVPPFEGSSYSSVTDCNEGCASLNRALGKAFSRAIHQTQADEERRYK